MAKILYSKVPFRPLPPKSETIDDAFRRLIGTAETAGLSTGYVSCASLEELDRLIHEPDSRLKQLTLILGMYRTEGMPESIWHIARMLDRKWRTEGIGQILIPKGFKDHEKVFLFSEPPAGYGTVRRTGILGSANLSFLAPDADNRSQYEVAALFDSEDNSDDNDALEDLNSQFEQTVQRCGPFEDVKFTLIRQENTALNGVKGVSRLTKGETETWRARPGQTELLIPLKVPKAKFRRFETDDQGNKTCSKSNINVCYSKPRNKKRPKPRSWYEMQLNVPACLRKNLTEYPKRNQLFFIVTDDGYLFKAATESDDNKQLSGKPTEHQLGRWVKGRLAAAGLVKPVDKPIINDPDRKSMITQEMLDEYGTDHLLFRKTGVTLDDEEGKPLDVWYMSFDPEEVNASMAASELKNKNTKGAATKKAGGKTADKTKEGTK